MGDVTALRAKLATPEPPKAPGVLWVDQQYLCPWCGSAHVDEGECDDYGQQIQPDHCLRCGAGQIGGYGGGDEEEQRIGWFRGEWPMEEGMPDSEHDAAAELALEDARTLVSGGQGTRLEVSVATSLDRYFLIMQLNAVECATPAHTFVIHPGSDDDHVILEIAVPHVSADVWWRL